ncbi:MAG: LysR family transcriptional regulator [Lachnospiraceae bacterium]
MDINHFSYFTTIVECGYNLSAAAKKIHITQSALSKIISTFEQEEGVRLFFRVNGRLHGLTAAGELFYNACLDISSRYDHMMEQVRQVSESEKSKVTIGIPPLVLTVLFTQVLSDFKINDPDKPLILIEAGAEELCQRFMNQELDFAVLLAPSNLKSARSREHVIYEDELTAFMADNHVLANKPALSWSDLDNQPIAIFNEAFSIHRYLMDKLKEENIKPVVALQSSSWDFLIESVINSNLITIMPSPIKHFVRASHIVERPFVDPITWKVVFVEHTDRKLTLSQQQFKEFVFNYTQELNK